MPGPAITTRKLTVGFANRPDPDGRHIEYRIFRGCGVVMFYGIWGDRERIQAAHEKHLPTPLPRQGTWGRYHAALRGIRAAIRAAELQSDADARAIMGALDRYARKVA